MKRSALAHIVTPRTHASFELDEIRANGDEIVEAWLVAADTREVYPIIAGIGVLWRDVKACVRRHGNVFERTPAQDPRMVRFIRRRIGRGFDRVPFEHVHAHYADLVAEPPEGFDTSRNLGDQALQEIVYAHAGVGHFRLAVHVGCGVGRGCFSLAEGAELVIGADRSAAHIRRARNISVTREHFFLAAPPGSGLKELPLDLTPLARERTDFVVAEPAWLPLATDSADLVVLEESDGHGAIVWGEAVASVRRVLAPDGTLVVPRARAPGLLRDGARAFGPYAVGSLA